MMTTSAVSGSSGVDLRSRRGESAASIQYDLVGLTHGRTILRAGNAKTVASLMADAAFNWTCVLIKVDV